MDLLSLQEYVIKKGRPHGHRYGKAPEKKEYHLVHNLKKRCKKRDFKGIHDRFSRDHVCHERVIQHNRDEEVCRAWDVLADEDHTCHLSEEEYFYYKNKWWLHLNKPGSDTLPLRKRSDFKQALSTLERFPLPTGRTNNGSRNRVRPLHGGNGKTPGGRTIQKVKKEASNVLRRTVRPVVDSTLAKTSEDGFQEFNLFCYI